MKKFFIFLFLIANSISAFAESIYVSQSGTGDGTSCSSPRSASWFNSSGNWGGGAGQINGGDTVYLCGTITSGLTMQGSGSSGSVITIDGASATLSGAVVAPSKSYFAFQNITWASGRAAEMLTLNSASNITLTNINLPGSLHFAHRAAMFNLGRASYITLNGLTATPQGTLFSAGNAHHLTFSNMNVVTTNDTMTNIERDLIRAPGVQYMTLEKSFIHKRWNNTGAGTYAHNDIWQVWGTSLDPSVVNPANNTLRYNKLITEDNGNSNYQFLMWSSIEGTNNIYGNMFIKKGSNLSGSMITTTHWTNNTTTLNIYNNTFIQKDTPTWYLLTLYNTTSSNTINYKNNVIYNSTGNGGVIEGSGSGTFAHQYNSYYGGMNNGYWGTSCASFASTGEVCNSTPNFYDYANDDYRIGVGSPAYNTGTDLGLTYKIGLSTNSNTFPNPELAGRPQGGTWDRGAYQYGESDTNVKVPMAPSILQIY